MDARCSCGALTASSDSDALFLIACHCTACQQRSGAPFGAGVYYDSASVAIAGTATEFVRISDAAKTFRTFFCPTCGSSLYWTIDGHAELIGIAAGMIAALPADIPVHSLWERSKRDWLSLDGAALHLPTGYPVA